MLLPDRAEWGAVPTQGTLCAVTGLAGERIDVLCCHLECTSLVIFYKEVERSSLAGFPISESFQEGGMVNLYRIARAWGSFE